MDSLTIQGNIYDLQFIKTLVKDGTDDERALDIFKQFQRDIYTTYKQIRHICNPRACEKTTLETVKKSLREHWLEHYLNMNLTEAHIVIEYAELFFGLAIK
ncbi:hypothetical protein ABHP49_005403 [Bacillus cereus]|uniref:hypothetical protein n=1 Tax=Bacillus TaxID=1386 RepID=UPI0006679FF6|nr:MULTISPECIES: hypothetical protein [Bacillus cereus group]KXY22011.1 hypothetical protein AT273_21720 [Bacillus cereus]KZD72368.1 hypothetical protein B4120_4799 [Bacillus cereus]MCO4216197.1 hypothetical protein [Bacillus sp. 10017]PFO18793.1 hypothetical protein COJ79_12285 [Bacillus thuringiensis]